MPKPEIGKIYTYGNGTIRYTCLAFASDGDVVMEYENTDGVQNWVKVHKFSEGAFQYLKEYTPPRTYDKWHVLYELYGNIGTSGSGCDTKEAAEKYATQFGKPLGVVEIKWTEDKK